MNESLLLISILFPILAGTLLPFHWQKLKSIKIVRAFVLIVTLLTSVFTWVMILFAGTEEFKLISFSKDFVLMLKFDGLGRFFAGIVATLWPFSVCYAIEYLKDDIRQNLFFAFFTMAFGVTLGVSMAGNIFTMYCFYELLTLSTVPLVMHTQTKEAILAARTYIIFSLGGAAFAFIAMVFLSIGAHPKTSDTLSRIIYLLGFFGFGVKAAIFPLCRWLPKASAAPTPVTALLHAVAVVKSGVFAIIRLTYDGFGIEVLKGSFAQTIALSFAIFTVIYGSVMAVKETHFKRRLAYSTVANLSYILCGVLLMTEEGLSAGLFHMATHAQMKILAFFCAGAILHQSKKEYIDELDGIARKMPFTMGCFTIAALALVGIPPLSGFVSKWYLLSGMAASDTIIGYLAAGGILIAALLTAIYMFSNVRRAYFPDKKANLQSLEGVKEANGWMIIPMVILAISIFFTGMFGGELLKVFEQIASQMVK